MGIYVNDNLLSGETLVYRVKLHWGIYAWSALFIFVGWLLYDIPGIYGWSYILIGIGLLKGLVALITQSSTEPAITNRRLIAKFGFIRRQTFEKRIDRLEGINFTQSILGRLLGDGTVYVGGFVVTLYPWRLSAIRRRSRTSLMN